MKRRGNDSNFPVLKADLPASLVVFLVALPLCLGIALGSQAPLFSGLIGGVVGGIVIGALSGSQLSVSGPAAGLTALVAAAIAVLPSYQAFLLAVVICGAIQLLLGFLRAGVLGDYIPSSVIKGMLAAIGLILILKQLPHLLGYHPDFGGDESFAQSGENTFSDLLTTLRFVYPWAALVGIVCLLIQIFWEKIPARRLGFIRALPAPLVVALVGVCLHLWGLTNYPELALRNEHLVQIPVADSVEGFFSFFIFPDSKFLTNAEVWITGFTLAIVASLESLLSIEATDELDPYRRVTPANHELKAQGVGNIVSGLLGGLPLTSVVVRSSANIHAGARTKWSTIFHGVLLLLSVAFIPGLLNLIPKACLAAILIHTGFKLAKPSVFREVFRKGWNQFLPFLVTVLAILLSDLLTGIIIGWCVGLFFVVRSNFRSAVFILKDENRYLFRLRKDVTFLNKPIVKQKLEEIPHDSYLYLDASRAEFIDRDVVEVIEDFIRHAPLRNIRVELRLNTFKDQGFSADLFSRAPHPESGH